MVPLLLLFLLLPFLLHSCKGEEPRIRSSFFTQYETLLGISADGGLKEIEGRAYFRMSVNMDQVERFASIYDDFETFRATASSLGDDSYPGGEIDPGRPVGTQVTFRNIFSSVLMHTGSGIDLSPSTHLCALTFAPFISGGYVERILDGPSPFFKDSYPWAVEGERYMWSPVDCGVSHLNPRDLLFLPYEIDLPALYLYVPLDSVPEGEHTLRISITDTEGNVFTSSVQIPAH